MKCRIKIHYWPVITALWFTITFITSYVISISNGHVYYFFPFISDTGAIPPESCIFGQMLNIGAVLMGITMYIRHRQINFAYNNQDLDISTRWQSSSKWLAIIACLGMSVVANFQETTVGVMHFTGAMGAFGLGSIYFIIQTRISFALMNNDAKYVINKCTLYLRVFLSFWLLPLFFSNTVLASLAMKKFDGEHIYYWLPENAGFDLRLISTFTEWFLAIFMLIFIGTFTNEFKSMDFEEIKIRSKIGREEQNLPMQPV